VYTLAGTASVGIATHLPPCTLQLSAGSESQESTPTRAGDLVPAPLSPGPYRGTGQLINFEAIPSA
jgi:hypothetical protein